MDTQRTLDYRTRHDARSLAFTVADNFESDRPIKARARRHFGPYLDQGQEGACVGFGTANSLGVTPDRRKDVSDELARSIYAEAKKIDEWPGEDYSGTSVLAGMKAAHAAGFIKGYYWATSLRQVQTGVAYLGPMVIGTNWYEGMFDVDSEGFLNVSGSLAGGHCTALVGVDMRRGSFVLQNSWGEGWGVKSRAYLRFADAERLIVAERGEAALPRK